jgi:hypothetical protein
VTVPIIPSNSTESSEEFTVTLDKIILLHGSIMLNLSEEERDRLILKPGLAVVKIIDDDGKLTKLMIILAMHSFYKST